MPLLCTLRLTLVLVKFLLLLVFLSWCALRLRDSWTLVMLSCIIPASSWTLVMLRSSFRLVCLTLFPHFRLFLFLLAPQFMWLWWCFDLCSSFHRCTESDQSWAGDAGCCTINQTGSCCRCVSFLFHFFCFGLSILILSWLLSSPLFSIFPFFVSFFLNHNSPGVPKQRCYLFHQSSRSLLSCTSLLLSLPCIPFLLPFLLSYLLFLVHLSSLFTWCQLADIQFLSSSSIIIANLLCVDLT